MSEPTVELIREWMECQKTWLRTGGPLSDRHHELERLVSPFNMGWILLSAYDALKAENEKLRTALKEIMRALAIHHKEHYNEPDLYTAVSEIARTALDMSPASTQNENVSQKSKNSDTSDGSET